MGEVQGTVRKYGWRRQRGDIRDHKVSPSYSVMRALAPSFNGILQRLPASLPIDQLALGSCTGNGYAEQVLLAHHLEGNPLGFFPSRLGIYYGERLREGTTDYDAGAEPRDGIKTVSQDGVWPEDQPGTPANWSYDIDRFTEKPPQACYDFGQTTKAITYASVDQDLCQFKGVLASGLPVGFGFEVYDSFEGIETSETGIVTMPGSDEDQLGGHWVIALGYDDLGADNGGFAPIDRCIVGINSWGVNWGGKLYNIPGGLFYMPYEYIMNPKLASDFWVVQTVS